MNRGKYMCTETTYGNVQSAIDALEIQQADDATAPNNATFTIATNTNKRITTELNATSVSVSTTITPALPTIITIENQSTVIFKVGTTKPVGLSFTLPVGASSFVWMDKPALSTSILQVSKTYTMVFFWESATICQVYYAINT